MHSDEESTGTPPYLDTSRSFEERAKDLVSRMTLGEKIGQMVHDAPAIPRLDIPAYNWWNECLHGVGRAGVATVFPQAIGLAATWNADLLYHAAVVISDEARAKHHEAVRRGERGQYQGLTFWSPNINLFRDPRWGRGQETYGEDPHLTGRMGVAFVKGLQGNHPKYLKVVATPKHFAVHSGPEGERHRFDARANAKDLWETYLPHFRECVVEAGAASVMGAYNRVNGEACCASPFLLDEILRGQWDFQGYVVSDCGAICDIHQHHRIVDTPQEAAALAVRNGCDLNCGSTYSALQTAVEQGLLEEADLDRALVRLFHARMRLGLFDPPEEVPYAQIPFEVNDCAAHRELSLQAAIESLVLLKNEDGFLPLSSGLERIAVVGPTGDSLDVLLGNYNGEPSEAVTGLRGLLNRAGEKTDIVYAKGCDLTGRNESYIQEAVVLAKESQAVIAFMGLSPRIEGEEGDAAESDFAGDRRELGLPGAQSELLRALSKTGVPIVLVLTGGSVIALEKEEPWVKAILMAWYPGQEGGNAIADVLFGKASPGGRLPLTFVRSVDQLPAFEEYGMKGRTYRFMREEPLYPFGFGLSYSQFSYEPLLLSSEELDAGEPLHLTVSLRNVSPRDGDEVVQVYLTSTERPADAPLRKLAGFQRVRLRAGERLILNFTLLPEQMARVDDEGDLVLERGEFEVHAGGSQPDPRSAALKGHSPMKARFRVKGGPWRPASS